MKPQKGCHGRWICDGRDPNRRRRCVYPRSSGDDNSRLGPLDTHRQRRRRSAFDPAFAATHRCDVYRYLFENFGPRRMRPCAGGHRVAAEFASALHDRQYRHRQDESSTDQRHALPLQAIHATSAPELNRRVGRRLVLKKCPLRADIVAKVFLHC